MRSDTRSLLPPLRALLPGLLFPAARLLEGRLIMLYCDSRLAKSVVEVDRIRLLGECALLGIVLLFWRQEARGDIRNPETAGRRLRRAGLALGLGLLLGLLTAAVTGLSGTLEKSAVTVPQALILCLVSPVSEELVYRGLVLERCRAVFSDRVSLVLSALLFAAGHGSPIRMAVAFGAGLVWGALFCRTKAVSGCCLSHTAANAAQLIILLQFAKVGLL